MKTRPILLASLMSFLSTVALRAEGPINVVASLPEFGTIAEAVGGDKVRVTSIASGLQDPHFVDPKPSYVVKLRDADLLLVNGLELELGWIPPLLDGARNPKINHGEAGYVDCSINIPVIERPSRDITRAEGDVHPLGNPHYMTDPLNGKIVADTIAKALARTSPGDANYFEERKKAFQHSLDVAMFGKALVDDIGGGKLERLCRSGELDAFLAKSKLTDQLGGWLGKMRPIKGRKIIFYHKSYNYFAERFGLDTAGYVELKPGIQPGPSHLAELVGKILHNKIPVVATHPFYDEKIGGMVAEKGHARLVTLPLGVGGVKGANDYLSLFDVVTDLLTRAYRG